MDASTRYHELIESCCANFFQRWSFYPTHVTLAPGRVNLIGEHTDYNSGWVLPVAIDRYTAIAWRQGAEPTQAPQASVVSHTLNREWNLDWNNLPAPRQGHGGDYLAGVLAGFQGQGVPLRHLNASIASNVPVGAGLSSSAALEVAWASVVAQWLGLTAEKLDLALLCQQAERDYAGVPCGLMDQLAATFGEVDQGLLIDCRSLVMQTVPIPTEETSWLVVNSGVKHGLADSQYPLRRQQCEQAANGLGLQSLREISVADFSIRSPDLPELLRCRARHVVTENQRVLDFAKAYQDRQWEAAGELLYASHDSLRDDYEVSCPEIDWLVRTARELGPRQGVWGSRITGGGFGGCTVTLVSTDNAQSVADRLCLSYQNRFGRAPQAFLVKPARGLHTVKI